MAKRPEDRPEEEYDEEGAQLQAFIDSLGTAGTAGPPSEETEANQGLHPDIAERRAETRRRFGVEDFADAMDESSGWGRERPEAGADVISPEDPAVLRRRFSREIDSVLKGEASAEAARTVYESLLHLRDLFLEQAERGDTSVRETLLADFAELVERRYRASLRDRKMPKALKKELADRDGRTIFEIKVWNEMCGSGVLHLQPRNKYTGESDERDFDDHINRFISPNEFNLFKEACSKIHGGASIKMLERLTKNALTEETQDRVLEGDRERAELAEEIRKRIEADLQQNKAEIKNAGGFARFISGASGVGLKLAATVALLNGGFLAAPVLWGIKPALEAITGNEFADLVQFGIDKGKAGLKSLLRGGAKMGLKKLPGKLKPEFMQEAIRNLEAPPTPSMARLGFREKFSSVPVGARWQHFKKSFLSPWNKFTLGTVRKQEKGKTGKGKLGLKLGLAKREKQPRLSEEFMKRQALKTKEISAVVTAVAASYRSETGGVHRRAAA